MRLKNTKNKVVSEQVAMRGERSVEKLSHFRCGVCSKWWSVGDAPISKKEWFCPWCGSRQKFHSK
jgi:rubrerythrin